MVTITVSAKDALGAAATGTVTVTQSAGTVPVLIPVNFSIPTATGLDVLIGTIVGTNTPTTYTIVSGDPNHEFAVYASSQHIRTSETIAPAPDGIYHLMVSGTNASGTGPAVAIGVTVGATPVVTSANNLTLTLPVTAGDIVGTMLATRGTPTAWAITAGNAKGYFAIGSTGKVSITAAGVAGLTASTYNLTCTATNALGTSSGMPVVIVLQPQGTVGGGGTNWSLVDGSLNPGGYTASDGYQPNLLNNYNSTLTNLGRNFNNPTFQPPWKVAGVDYPCGYRFGTPTKNPATAGEAGTTWSASGQNLFINTNNFVCTGYDFTNASVTISDGVTGVTITDNFFETGNYPFNDIIHVGIGCTGVIIQYNVFDGTETAGGNQDARCCLSRAYGDTIILQYNVYKNFGNHPIENAQGNTDPAFGVIMRWNVMFQGAIFTGQHLNYMQFGGGTVSNASFIFNTTLQQTSVAGGEGPQFYMNTAAAPGFTNTTPGVYVCGWNTMVSQNQPSTYSSAWTYPGAGGTGTISYFIHNETLVAGSGPGNLLQIGPNYFDPTTAIGFYYNSNEGTNVAPSYNMLNGLTIQLNNSSP